LDPSTYDPAHVLVRLADPGVAAGTVLATGVTVSASYSLVPGLYKADLSSGVSVPQALAELQADPRVLEAEPDSLLVTEATPNDPGFGTLYGLNNTGQSVGGTAGIAGDDIHAVSAWNVTTGSYKTVVSVMDTGIDYDHPDLYRNIWINQA